MKKILKKHKKLNIDFYLYDSFLFLPSKLYNNNVGALRRQKKSHSKFILIRDSKTDVYYCGKNITWRERDSGKLYLKLKQNTFFFLY